MGTKLEELRSGCFHAAMDDEPMFVLLARDPDAPRIVRNWASSREDEIDRGVRPSSDMDKVREARAAADKMERWRTANDGAWRDGLFADPIPSRGPFAGERHMVRQEHDEYACSCGARWGVEDGEDHP